MIYLQLFLGFLKVGLFSFGGAYSAIPLIREVSQTYGWIDDEMLSVMIGVSESTPGPIMVNLATYVGSNQAGVLGAVIATFAVVLPAFVIIILVTALFNALLKKPLFNAVLNALKCCVVGVILAVGITMAYEQLVENALAVGFSWQTCAIAALCAALVFLPPLFKKKAPSALLIIGVGAVAGAVLYAL